MNHEKWCCVKCQHREFETGEIRVTGGIFSKIFDVQNKKYLAVTCERCSYTEFYKSSSSTLGNVFDFFTN